MFRRGMAGLAMAGVLLMGIAVPGVLADTTGGGNADVYDAAGFFEGPQKTSVYVSVSVGKSDGVAFSNLYANQFSYQDITCKGKGKKTFPGQIYTNVSGFSEGTAVIKIDKKLGTATASDTLTVTEDIFNTCTGKDTFRDFTLSVSMDLHATSGLTSNKSKSETTFPDGHKEIFTGKFDSREAAGDLHFGGTSYAAPSGYIQHSVTTFVIIPAH